MQNCRFSTELELYGLSAATMSPTLMPLLPCDFTVDAEPYPYELSSWPCNPPELFAYITLFQDKEIPIGIKQHINIYGEFSAGLRPYSSPSAHWIENPGDTDHFRSSGHLKNDYIVNLLPLNFTLLFGKDIYSPHSPMCILPRYNQKKSTRTWSHSWIVICRFPW